MAAAGGMFNVAFNIPTCYQRHTYDVHFSEVADQVPEVPNNNIGSTPAADRLQEPEVVHPTEVSATKFDQEDATDDEFYDSHEYTTEELEVFCL